MVAAQSLAKLYPLATRRMSPVAWLRSMLARHRMRAELRRLLETAEYLLADVGVGVDEVRAELAKPFWRS